MASKVPIKKDLFRFVTFRSPEHLDPKSKYSNFIVHPYFTDSRMNSCPVAPAAPNTSDPIFQAFLTQFPQMNNPEAEPRGILLLEQT
jgi:hypothetical protein